ncbi:hypothetical protein FH972_022419 [Carpinus fangiana]|uniref:Uncharacterized protein n=1 Tax=Carpinus fangiana TaxID=176857 RepID=A0A5N6KSR8_9ROSI|nr:hypothetical protein FH972_022419 [Carpinus fangiana]
MDNSKLFSVKGKVVLVTGGAKGIGRMISEGYVRNGATVYISSRDAKSCEEACKELNAAGPGKAYSIPADFYKEADCKRLAEEFGKREKKLHVLVNNSGSNWGAPYDEFPDAAWVRVLTLNLQRVFTITQLLTPYLEAAQAEGDPGRIINIGSVDGLRVPALETFSYSASKAGLHHLSRVLANHLGRRNITSNTIACGPFQSKMMKATLEQFKDTIEASIPLGRIGSPEDVAGTCLFLSSRAGSYVNGATIALDGGSLLTKFNPIFKRDISLIGGRRKRQSTAHVASMVHLTFSAKLLLVACVLLVALPSPAAAFGAGNIASISKVEGHNWRHGDIEDMLKTVAFLKGHKWSSMMIKRVYFGNWLRDYSQAVDVGTLKGVQAGAIRILVWILSFMAFGYATAEFEVTDERLGVYRPEEHIDNPEDYADNVDARQFDPRLRGPIQKEELEVDPQTGMKNYIANERGGWATSSGYIKHSFTRSIHFGRLYTNGASGLKGREEDLCEALRCLGQGLHCLEDFGAHTNYVELALREMGFHEVFPHTGTGTSINLQGHQTYPLVTGTFGGVDFLHSVLGEVTDHVTQTEIEDMNKALGEQSRSNAHSEFLSVLGQVPGTDHLVREANELQSQSRAQAAQNTSRGMEGDWATSRGTDEGQPPAYSHEMPGSVPQQPGQEKPTAAASDVLSTANLQATVAKIYPILEFRDRVVKTISGIVSKIPGLEKLIETISERITLFIMGLLAPYIQPIITAASKQLKFGSSTVVEASGRHQFLPWTDPHCTAPTHSLLSKDHFSNILNGPAGEVASAILQYVAPRVIYAWENPGVPVDQVMSDIVHVFHHPAMRDQRQEVHRNMFAAVEKWVQTRPNRGSDLNRLLSSQSVKDGKNHTTGSNPHTHGPSIPGFGNIGHQQQSQNGGQHGGGFGQMPNINVPGLGNVNQFAGNLQNTFGRFTGGFGGGSGGHAREDPDGFPGQGHAGAQDHSNNATPQSFGYNQPQPYDQQQAYGQQPQGYNGNFQQGPYGQQQQYPPGGGGYPQQQPPPPSDGETSRHAPKSRKSVTNTYRNILSNVPYHHTNWTDSTVHVQWWRRSRAAPPTRRSCGRLDRMKRPQDDKEEDQDATAEGGMRKQQETPCAQCINTYRSLAVTRQRIVPLVLALLLGVQLLVLGVFGLLRALGVACGLCAPTLASVVFRGLEGVGWWDRHREVAVLRRGRWKRRGEYVPWADSLPANLVAEKIDWTSKGGVKSKQGGREKGIGVVVGKLSALSGSVTELVRHNVIIEIQAPSRESPRVAIRRMSQLGNEWNLLVYEPYILGVTGFGGVSCSHRLAQESHGSYCGMLARRRVFIQV